MAFKPGKSGNPNGRPRKKESLTQILAEVGETLIDPKDTKSLTYKKALALKWWQIALKGNENMIVNLYRRVDGKERETIDNNLSGVNGLINPVMINIQPVPGVDKNEKE